MLPYILSSTGWLAMVLAAATTLLPYLLRPTRIARFLGLSVPRAASLAQRLRPHIFLGILIVVLGSVHGWAAMALPARVLSRFNQTGLVAATLCLALILVQALLGARLAQPASRMRLALRRWHFWAMGGILATAVAHIALNSALLRAALNL